MKLAVIDASIVMRAVLPARGEAELNLIRSLLKMHTHICAPDLWKSEVTSSLRRFEYRQLISQEEAEISLADAFSLHIESVAVDQDTCQQALAWARQLGHSKAYDALYLALAKNKGADFWTADQRLWKRCDELKLSWVKTPVQAE